MAVGAQEGKKVIDNREDRWDLSRIVKKWQRPPIQRSLKQAMDRLREKAGFYVRADLYSAIIREGEEEK